MATGDKRLNVDKSELEAILKQIVNGKIDRVYDHLLKQDKIIKAQGELIKTNHNEIKPYLEGIAAVKLIVRWDKYIAGFLIGAAATYAAVKAFIYPFN